MFRSKTNTIIATIAAIVSILGFGYYMQPKGTTADNIISSPTQAANKIVSIKTLMEPNQLPENILGSKNAKVTIVEYSSMTCPHCATFHEEVLPAIKKKYIDTGKVKYILREFPLDNLAAAAFMLGRCAPKDKYFPFIEMMYGKQKVWAFGKGDPLPAMLKLAKGAGFTKESFDTCLKDQKILDGINAVRARGSKLGINSTPSFFVNGELIKQFGDVKSFSAMLDKKLK